MPYLIGFPAPLQQLWHDSHFCDVCCMAIIDRSPPMGGNDAAVLCCNVQDTINN